MIKFCPLTKEEFLVSDQELELIKKMNLQPPLFSPKAREIMRMAFRNDRNLFLRKCDGTGERIMSVYRENAPFPVYKYEYWISDDWEVPSLNFNPDKDFFEQYAELQRITPRVNLFAPYNENCDYVNAAEKNKNCYMHILADRCEDCYYTHAVFGSRDCMDCAYVYDSEMCFECTDSRNMYGSKMCFLCDNCSDLNFCFDMKGCRECFFCEGLRNQEYHFFNKKLSKEEYEEKMRTIDLGSYETFDEYRKKFIEEIVSKKDYIRMINTENSDGNFLVNTKNCHKCYDLEYAEDCFYTRLGANHIKDVHHSYAIVDGSELIIGNISTTESYNCHNVIGCWTSRESAYSEFIQGCSNCIGCISLRRKNNCILNKEYSPEEFARLKKIIIEKLGDYYGNPFPFMNAPFSYMDSVYKDYHLLKPEEVTNIGWRYGEKDIEEKSAYESVNIIPDNVNDFDDDYKNKIFTCSVSGRPFKIIAQEIAFLKKIHAPIPRKHHEVRFQERVRWKKA